MVDNFDIVDGNLAHQGMESWRHDYADEFFQLSSEIFSAKKNIGRLPRIILPIQKNALSWLACGEVEIPVILTTRNTSDDDEPIRSGINDSSFESRRQKV